MLSVIIPTRNHCRTLASTLESISRQTLDPDLFTVMVVDNGSKDATKGVVDSFENKIPNLHYYYDESPGLHVGRHRGLREAKSDILVYADDDTEAFPTWLEGIVEAFNDKNVALVGGKNLPKFQSKPPKWLIKLWSKKHAHGNVLGYLSILDLGNQKKLINPYLVFGCNFSIRKQVLLEAGGFHPDAMPEDLIHFRGDGETHVSAYIDANHYKAVYNPKASVYHWVPEMRMNIGYFCHRAYRQGISDSYTEIRRTKGAVSISNEEVLQSKFRSRMGRLFYTAKEKALTEIPSTIRHQVRKYSCLKDPRLTLIRMRIDSAHRAGYAFHQKMVRENPKLKEWVLQEDYMAENGIVMQ